MDATSVMMGVVLFGVFAVPVAALVALAKRGGEQCPEREPDLSNEDRAYLRGYFQTNRWEG